MKKRDFICIIIGAIAVLFGIFFFKDWFCFLNPGGLDICTDKEFPNIQRVTKYFVTIFSVIIALIAGKNAFSSRDNRLQNTAFLGILLADFCLEILFSLGVDLGELGPTGLGICFFFLVQNCFIYRHTRTSDQDRHLPKIYLVPAIALIVSTILFLAGKVSLTIAVIITYGLTLIPSLIVALRVHKTGFYPAFNNKLIKIGMILFFLCDVNVGISFMEGSSTPHLDTIGTIANNIIWLFYSPALVLLALSAYKLPEKK